MKKLALESIVLVTISMVVSHPAFSAPNYSFSGSTTQNSQMMTNSSVQQKVQVYKPANYIQNRIVQNTSNDIVEIVIDYSGSMRNWITKAQETMRQILPQIPSNTQVGLRVFGQKMNKQVLNSNNLFKNIAHDLGGAVGTIGNTCSATSQLVSVSSVNPSLLVSSMNSAKIGSSTPLTLALEETIYKDFANKNSLNKKKIILITDGGESCGRNPCSFIRQVVQTRNDIQIDVIMINGSNELRCLADATGGNFYNAGSSYKFDSALESSLKNIPVNGGYQGSSSSVQNIPSSGTVNKYKFLK